MNNYNEQPEYPNRCGCYYVGGLTQQESMVLQSACVSSGMMALDYAHGGPGCFEVMVLGSWAAVVRSCEETGIVAMINGGVQ